ncbi:MAG TPA: tetratricopeptide repeat protein [Mucilaginibacter sp.]|jgi:tetratricopeptide (TPR) repeat protein|nr:tetratricopeptide repeat protein [Mucilaginibacter sp.]
MDTYYTIEEKYLQAVEEVNYGESPKAFQLLKEIIDNDPLYARAHFQLGKIYYYEIRDYQTAGYHFKTCMDLEPSFPDNYFHYLSLVVFLRMEKQANHIIEKALEVPGVNISSIYELQGLFFEKSKNFSKALNAYQRASVEVTTKDHSDTIEESLDRVKEKIRRGVVYQYQLTG